MTFFYLWPLTGRSDDGVTVDTFARLSMPHTLTLLFRSFEVVWNFDLFWPLFLGQRSNAGQSHMTSAGAPSAHPDQVWYKIGWIEHDTKDIGRAMSFTKYRARRAASSMIFLKLIARSISLSIVRKNPSNFIIIMFKIRYFCILTDITNRYYCISVSWEHNNGCNRVRHRHATAKCQSLLTDRWKDVRTHWNHHTIDWILL